MNRLRRTLPSSALYTMHGSTARWPLDTIRWSSGVLRYCNRLYLIRTWGRRWWCGTDWLSRRSNLLLRGYRLSHGHLCRSLRWSKRRIPPRRHCEFQGTDIRVCTVLRIEEIQTRVCHDWLLIDYEFGLITDVSVTEIKLASRPSLRSLTYLGSKSSKRTRSSSSAPILSDESYLQRSASLSA